MRIKYLIILLGVSLCEMLMAQNGNFSSLPMFNQMYYNPGYAGDGRDIEARFLNRNQWMGMPGAPNTATFNIDAPFNLFGHNHGVGLSIVNDILGNFKNTELNLSYAYRKSLIQGEIGIGIGLNMISHALDGEWIYPDGPGGSDVLVPQNMKQEPMLFDANLGLFYKADNLYMSLSSRNFSGTRVKYMASEGGSAVSTKQLLVGRQLYFNTGYDYQLPNPMFSLQPSVFIGTDFSSTQLSIASLVTYNKRFFGGLSYKQTDALIAIFGIDLPSGIHAAVAYDIPTSRIIKYSSGSFEFMIGYKFSLDIDKDNRKYKSVRFL